jgi:hypothetical protein
LAREKAESQKFGNKRNVNKKSVTETAQLLIRNNGLNKKPRMHVMNHISNSMNQYFTRSTFRPSSSPQANSRRQPTIRPFRENNVDTGIEIHSLDYDFPIENKARTKLAQLVARPGPEAENGKTAAEQLPGPVQMHASEPTYQDSVPTESKNPKTLPALESATMDSVEEVSGFSADSFFDSIHFGDSFSLELHIEQGFRGSHEFMLDEEKYNAFDYAMRCKNFAALMALAPTVKAGHIINALEKNPAFIHEHRDFSMQLFNALN